MGTVTSKDGTRIAFDRIGEGPALILVDGALCYREFGPMRSLAARLAPLFSVYTYDRRGRGESGDTLPYAVEREVEDLEALIEHAGEQVSVYGLSSGAALALQAAARTRAIGRLALYEPPYAPDGRSRPSTELARRLSDLVAAGQRGDAVELFMRSLGVPAGAVAPMRHTPVWPMLEGLAPTLPYDGAIISQRRWQAAALGIPVLVMTGGASPAWRQEAARALRQSLPHARLRTLPGQAHEVAAAALAPALIGFFGSG